MSVFNDDKYEALDWLSKATEPIEGEICDTLALIPTVIDIDWSLIEKIHTSPTAFNDQLSIDTVINYIIFSIRKKWPSYDENSLLRTCFIFEVEPNTTIDYEKCTINGKITLVKTNFILEEKKLISYMTTKVVNALRDLHYERSSVARMNEIMDMIGGFEPEIFATNSFNKKNRAMIDRISTIFTNDEWKIRNIELAIKIANWICSYIDKEDLSALANFCKLKVMTHKNLPIYSLKEIE